MKHVMILLGLACSILLIRTATSKAGESAPVIPYKVPPSPASFNPLFHFQPVNQDSTNACWSFATLSFIESEMDRLNGEAIKLAVMFPVYYAFIEKAKYFVATRGTSRFMPGDLFPTVIDIIQTYGVVPESVYHGQADNSPVYSHTMMETEIASLKEKIKRNEIWDEKIVLEKLSEILNHFLGKPPDQFIYNGESFTPISFAARYVNLPWKDYLLLTSFSYAPFWSYITYTVPDNWLQKNTYFNLPLDKFYDGIVTALSHGFSVAIDGDIGEPGRLGKRDVCFVPAFDIPSEYIGQEARDYRFDRKISTDDHLMHMIGYLKYEGQDWFLVKDSWRDAWEGRFKGYFLYHADYVRLKVLACLVHKDAVPEIRDKIRDWK